MHFWWKHVDHSCWGRVVHGMDNSYVDVWWPHAGSVIVLVKSHVPSWRPVRMIAVDETSVCVSCIACILAIETASMFRPHPISVPGCGNVKNVHVTFCNSRPVMIGLYILPWQDMKWCQDNGSLIVLDWETGYVLAGFSDVDWDAIPHTMLALSTECLEGEGH